MSFGGLCELSAHDWAAGFGGGYVFLFVGGERGSGVIPALL